MCINMLYFVYAQYLRSIKNDNTQTEDSSASACVKLMPWLLIVDFTWRMDWASAMHNDH